MLFKPHHIDQIRSGSKTVTRRDWSPAYNPPRVGSIQMATTELFATDTACDCYIRILDVYDQPLGELDDADAQREGDYETVAEFREAWEQINGEGSWDSEQEVAVVEFEYVGRERPQEVADADD